MSLDTSSDGGGNDRKPSAQPAKSTIHLALLLAHMCCGGGAIVGKIGIHGGNPVLFALIREGIAGAMLFAISIFLGGRALPGHWVDLRLVFAAGACIFVNHLCYILGLKVADPISGAAWQPAQPIVTASLAIAVGYEEASLQKALGISISVCGAMFMVLYGKADAKSSGGAVVLGHFLFLCNCIAASGYVIISKRLLKRYPVASVSGWSYLVASCLMFCTTAFVNSNEESLALVCADDNMLVKSNCMLNAWVIPSSMLFPLIYYVLLGSLGAYFMITWANQYANASIVSAYTVAQPVTSSFVSALLVSVGGPEWAASYGMRSPGTQDLGVVAIIGGLSILFQESASADAAALREKSNPSSSSKESRGSRKNVDTSPRRAEESSAFLELKDFKADSEARRRMESTEV